MKNKILIGIVIVAGAFGLVIIYSRMAEVREHVVMDERYRMSTPSENVRSAPIKTNFKDKPGRALETSDNIERLKSEISDVLESRQDRDQKMDEARGMLEKLSGLEGSARTIEWLKKTVGDGSDFSVLVSGIFLGAKEPLEILFKEIDSLPIATRSGVSAVLFQKIFESDEPAELIKAALSSGDSKSLGEGMDIALQLSFMQSRSISDSMSSMRSIMNRLDGEGLTNFRNAYLSGLSKVSPKDAWREMQILGQASPDADSWQAGLRDKISAQLRALGASQSLEFLIQEGGSASEVEKSVSMWGNMNPVELNRWISDQMKRLPASQQDGVRAGLANLSLDKRDFSAVQEQLDGIVDGKVRADLERRMWEGQRKTIRQDVLNDPNGTLMAIVSGSCQYGDYWLEEAMGTWVAKDFDKAQDWYQKNWNSMPANKSQFLAAAFAKQAASQGDTATARQWAAHIQDAKTRQRIDAGIAKAEAKQGN